MQRRVVVMVVDGFTDSGLSIALDVFRAANSLARRSGAPPPFAVAVASPDAGPVRAASGLVFEATRAAARIGRSDVVLVPGLWVESAAEIDAACTRDDVRRLLPVLERAHDRGAIVGASCTGAFLLAEAGLLDGRRCTTAWWLAPHLSARHPSVTLDADLSLVVDGRVATTGAVFAQADLALHLVAHFAGPELARQCGQVLLLDRHPLQAGYMAMQYLSASDDRIRRAERWARAHLADDFDIAALARRSGMSPRTFARRLGESVGLSPIAFVRRLRAEVATRLLATTALSLEEVGRRVGYRDADSLRRLLLRETGTTPREIRRRRATEPARSR
jgi:transcriptional regulator GlxA family with amidase domain